MITISKMFDFCASHSLKGLDPDHPCGRTHGHNYVVRVFLTGAPGPDGFVVDYRKLEDVKAFIDTKLDHRHLNDVFDFQPSVEMMCVHLYLVFKGMHPELSAVEMSETPKTWCRYAPMEGE